MVKPNGTSAVELLAHLVKTILADQPSRRNIRPQVRLPHRPTRRAIARLSWEDSAMPLRLLFVADTHVP
ncbi:MAG TPA: hypothetical protein VFD99_01020, partial [Arthrobacter sp.]|nr:hypothetical protein [Arthrobacter sp.]